MAAPWLVSVPRSLRERRISPVWIDTARARSPSRSKSAQLLESEPGLAKSAVWTGVKAGPAVPAVPPPAMPVDRTAQDRTRISSSRMMRTPEDGGDQKSSDKIGRRACRERVWQNGSKSADHAA